MSKLAVNAAIVQNILLERQLWLRRQLDSMRDIDQECGHPSEVTTEDCKKAFLRGDIASRVVSVWPEETWAENPEVFETEKQTETPFEKEFIELEKKHRLFSVLQRADTLSGIGRFGVVLLGLSDGKALSEPAPGITEKGDIITNANAKLELLYVRPFDEQVVRIDAFETNTSNPRYGLPVLYNIQFQDVQGTANAVASNKVHWSRIIHLADNRMSSDVYGLPRMEKVYNRLLDLKKISGGSGEMFWKGGFPGLSLETLPGEDVEIDEEGTKKQLEAYMEGLQRYIALQGMSAKSLTPQVADPGSHVEVQIKLIAAALGVPWRVFIGSEAAQLASEQDARAWIKRLTRRRKEYVTPFVILPTVERLIAFGALSKPKEIQVHWPDLNTPSDKEKAEVASMKTTALAKYAMGGVDLLIPPFHYLTLILGMEDDEAKAVIDAASERMEEVQLEEEERALEEPEEDEEEEGEKNGETKRGRPTVKPTVPLRP